MKAISRRRTLLSSALAAALAVGACGGGERGRDEFGDPGEVDLSRPGDAGVSQHADAGADGGADVPTSLGDASSADGAQRGSDAGLAGGDGAGDRSASADAFAPPVVCSPAGVPAGCQQSLVLNASFDHDGTSWTSESYATQAFNPDDWAGQTTSGSLLVTNTNVDPTFVGLALSGARQCVSLPGAGNYELSAQVLLGNSAGDSSGAAIGLFLYDSADCQGSPISTVSPILTAKGPSWIYLSAGVISTGTAKSAAIRLLVQKPFKQPAASAAFDNVLFQRL